MKDSKSRFSDRVIDYKKYRPTYPVDAIEFVKDHCKADSKWKIADIGSGTGISTQVLLSVFKCPVYAVEPNENMRKEAELSLGCDQLFHSVNGCSEDTSLANRSIDLIAAFQAFHWFDKIRTRKEFKRISREPNWILLVWNDRITKGTDFLEGYEIILKRLPEYLKVNHKGTGKKDIQEFIGNDDLTFAEFPNFQKFDFEGLKGRFFSSSYTPAHGTEEYRKQVRYLKELFDRTNVGGFITFSYVTQVYLGKIT